MVYEVNLVIFLAFDCSWNHHILSNSHSASSASERERKGLLVFWTRSPGHISYFCGGFLCSFHKFVIQKIKKDFIHVYFHVFPQIHDHNFLWPLMHANKTTIVLQFWMRSWSYSICHCGELESLMAPLFILICFHNIIWFFTTLLWVDYVVSLTIYFIPFNTIWFQAC